MRKVQAERLANEARARMPDAAIEIRRESGMSEAYGYALVVDGSVINTVPRWVEYRELGPREEERRFQLRLAASLYDTFQRMAARRGSSMNQEITQACREYAQQHGTE